MLIHLNPEVMKQILILKINHFCLTCEASDSREGRASKACPGGEPPERNRRGSQSPSEPT